MYLTVLTKSEKLVFKANSYVEPFYKKKLNHQDIYEDRALAASTMLMVTDGIGGSHFPAGPIANAILYGIFTITNKHIKKNLTSEHIKEGINSGIDHYIKIYKKLIKKKQINIKPENLLAATTLAGVALRKKEKLDSYNFKVFQVGDSRTMIFYPLNNQGKIVYIARCMTDERQYSFNFPHQIESRIKPDNTKNLYFELFTAHKHDIVLVGSDGLFDNLPQSLINIFLNIFLFGFENQKAKMTPDFDTLIDKLLMDWSNFQKENKLIAFTDQYTTPPSGIRKRPTIVFSPNAIVIKNKEKIRMWLETWLFKTKKGTATNFFSLTGCTLADYFEKEDQNVFSSCIMALLNVIHIKNYPGKDIDTEKLSQLFPKIVKKMEKNNDYKVSYLIPFNLIKLAKTNTLDLKIKKDDIGVAIGYVTSVAKDTFKPKPVIKSLNKEIIEELKKYGKIEIVSKTKKKKLIV